MISKRAPCLDMAGRALLWYDGRREVVCMDDYGMKKWLGVLSDGCTAEEMLPLRDRALNEGLMQELK